MNGSTNLNRRLMDLKTAKHPSRSLRLLMILSSLCVALGLSKCAHAPPGPAITGCVVDVKNQGFQCDKYPDERSFIPFEKFQGKCLSPQDLENSLKSCYLKRVPLATWCQFDRVRKAFSCIKP